MDQSSRSSSPYSPGERYQCSFEEYMNYRYLLSIGAMNPWNRNRLFEKFQLLPKEIRDMIWKFALPGPRIVYLEQYALKEIREEWNRDYEAEKNDEESPPPILYESHWGFHSHASPPSILLVCRESYAIASQFYTRAFPCPLTVENSDSTDEKERMALAQTYFDFDHDILYLVPLSFCMRFHDSSTMGPSCQEFIASLRYDFYDDELEKVQHLAIAFDLNCYVLQYQQIILVSFLAEVLSMFGNVKNLTLVCEYHGKKDNVERTINPNIGRFSTEQKGRLTFLGDMIDLTEKGPLEIVGPRSVVERVGISGKQIVNGKQLLKEAIKKQYAWGLDVAMLEEIRKDMEKDGYEWKMPEIDYRLIVCKDVSVDALEALSNTAIWHHESYIWTS